jgi:FMN phosphatase YigB (HAD superfamily)
MKKAIIFDLYDTLIEIQKKSKPYLYLLNHLNQEINITPKDIINHIMVNDMVAIGFVRQLLDIGILNPSFDQSQFLKFLDDEVETASIIPGTYKALNRLKESGYRLFVLSNLATPYKYPYYRLNIENWIEKAFFSCDCRDKKPNASFFQQVIDYSGLNKEDFIMIGDNPISDIKGATEFGIDTILKEKNISLDILTVHL